MVICAFLPACTYIIHIIVQYVVLIINSVYRHGAIIIHSIRFVLSSIS
nr:MAG TPA: hypothetical protein [Caudoviricetes sp.]